MINKKLISCVVLLIFVFISSVSGVLAAPDEETSCNPLQEWRLFLTPILGWGNFDDYWGDFLRNYCQYLDIEEVRQELIVSRSLVRQAMYDCNYAFVQEEKLNYYKFEVELWYLRNFISSKDEISVLKSPAIIKFEIKAKFVDDIGILTEAQADEYFEEFQEKYKDHFEAYQDCKADVTLGDLIDKAKELVRTIGASSSAGWKEERKAAKTRRGETEEDKKEKEEKGSKEGASSGFWSSLYREQVEHEINQKKPKETVNEIIDKFKRITDDEGSGSSSPYFSDVYQYKDQEDVRYDVDINLARKKATYELLYKDTGDSISYAFEKMLLRLNEAIISTNTDIFPDIKTLVETINKKQCAAN